MATERAPAWLSRLNRTMRRLRDGSGESGGKKMEPRGGSFNSLLSSESSTGGASSQAPLLLPLLLLLCAAGLLLEDVDVAAPWAAVSGLVVGSARAGQVEEVGGVEVSINESDPSEKKEKAPAGEAAIGEGGGGRSVARMARIGAAIAGDVGGDSAGEDTDGGDSDGGATVGDDTDGGDTAAGGVAQLDGGASNDDKWRPPEGTTWYPLHPVVRTSVGAPYKLNPVYP
jgi:hypothetical protein